MLQYIRQPLTSRCLLHGLTLPSATPEFRHLSTPHSQPQPGTRSVLRLAASRHTASCRDHSLATAQPALLMTAVESLNNLGGFDPFADAAETDDSGKDYVHIRVQQRNGKKSLTTIQGLEKGFDYKKVLKAFKKEFCCNGTVVEDTELGQVIQLQGDQRKNVSGFLVANKLAKKELIKIHGF